MAKTFLTADQAAALWGGSRRHFLREARRYQLAVCDIRTRSMNRKPQIVLFPIAEVEQFISNHPFKGKDSNGI